MYNQFSEIFDHSVEGALVFSLGTYRLIQQVDLELYSKHQKDFTEKNNCNIYFILCRSKVTINPKHFIAANDYCEVEFLFQDKSNVKAVRAKIPGLANSIELELKSDYPYTYFSIHNKGENVFGGKASTIVDILQSIVPIKEPLMDYQILYIGQSKGRVTKTNALSRVIKHENLQKIYSEGAIHFPNKEIWIMCCAFNQQNITMSGLPHKTKVSMTKEYKRFQSFVNLKLSSDQCTNIIEAALIRYFEPKYNEVFKDNFPNEKHKSYSESFKADLNAVVIEVNTEESFRYLYTKTRKRKIDHIVIYHLRKEEERVKMFDLKSYMKKPNRSEEDIPNPFCIM